MTNTRSTPSRRRSRRQAQGGWVMVLTMIALMLFMTIILLGVAGSNTGAASSGAVTVGNNGMRMSAMRLNTVQAFNLAESGAEYTIQWLHDQAAPPAYTRALGPDLWTNTSSNPPDRQILTVRDATGNAAGTISVKIYPASNNPSNNQKAYMIESVGTCNGMSETLDVYTQQESFGKYSYFTNTEWSDGFWVAGLNVFDGPMHTNSVDVHNRANPNPIPTNILWYNTANASPMFTYNGPDAFSCVAPTVSWYKNGLGTQQGPQSASDWNDVATGGAASVHTGASAIPLPTSSTLQQQAALGTAAMPTTNGVTIPTGGGSTNAGIYVTGNVQDMTLSCPTSTTQKIDIKQTGSNGYPLETVVTVNLASNTTTSVATQTNANGTTTTTTQTANGVTNGVVYCTGSIGSNGPPSHGISGTIADNYTDAQGNIIRPSQFTLATSAQAGWSPGSNGTVNASNGDIYMNGSITYNTMRAKDVNGNPIPESQDANYVEHAGTLGIVTPNLLITDTNPSGQVLKNVEVDAAVMAYGLFQANNAFYGGQRGSFTSSGGYIADTGGLFGEIDNNGNLIAGFAEHYHYDARLADTPPPFFPTTGNNYGVLSWKRVGGIIE